MIVILGLIGCIARHNINVIGAVDTIDKEVCTIQLEDETTVLLTSKLCKKLKEGDTLYAVSAK